MQLSCHTTRLFPVFFPDDGIPLGGEASIFRPEPEASRDNRLSQPDPIPSSWPSHEQRKALKSRCISRGSSHPFHFEPPIEEKLMGSGGKPTVQFSGCIISRAFLKERPSEGLVGSLIGRALLANADALCAAATPMMNNVFDV